MTSPYDLFKEKQIDETTPAVLDYGSFQFHIKHAGASNKTFVNAAQFQLKQFERLDSLDSQGVLSADGQKELEEKKHKVLAKLYAELIMVGWDNVKDKDGKEIDFSVSAAEKLFNDLPILFKDVIEQSVKVSNFKALEEEADSKN